MKIAFNLAGEINEQAQHLLIEAGNTALSFILFNKDPLQITGVLTANFDEQLSDLDRANQARVLLEKETILRQNYRTVNICYNNAESILVPPALFQPDNRKAMLDIQFGERGDAIICHDHANGIMNVYRAGKNIDAVLRAFYPMAAIHHATSLQWRALQDRGTDMYCIFYHNSFKVFLYKDGALQIVQHFSYHTAADVIYYLLGCCQAFDVDVNKVDLVVAGMIDERSNLYSELHKYFLQLRFDDPAIQTSDAIRGLPAHFFSHLMLLSSCV
ncbi:MAG: hypothetical protein JWQ27_477 [Ferruginibacter sp.]|nr:hypothetical protein [Ferruginibacter sp.]